MITIDDIKPGAILQVYDWLYFVLGERMRKYPERGNASAVWQFLCYVRFSEHSFCVANVIVSRHDLYEFKLVI